MATLCKAEVAIQLQHQRTALCRPNGILPSTILINTVGYMYAFVQELSVYVSYQQATSQSSKEEMAS